MHAPVVTVDRTAFGRLTVKWFPGTDAAEQDAWVARATSRGAEVRGEHTSDDCLAARCMHTLLADGVDLRWCATHRRRGLFGDYQPVA